MKGFSIPQNRELTKADYASMSPEDFKNAFCKSGSKYELAREKYLLLIAKICGEKIYQSVPDRNTIINDIVNDTIAYVFKKLDSYDENKIAFSNYFKNPTIWCLHNYLDCNGLSSEKMMIEDGVKAQAVPLDKVDEGKCQESPEKAKLFSIEMIPIIREFATNLPEVKFRIFMAKYGITIAPEFYTVEECLNGPGHYAEKLSEEFAKEGKHITPGAIRTALRGILKELRQYIIDHSDYSLPEIHQHLSQLIVAEKTEISDRESVRKMLLDIDVERLSDDEAAWLLVQLIKR